MGSPWRQHSWTFDVCFTSHLQRVKTRLLANWNTSSREVATAGQERVSWKPAAPPSMGEDTAQVRD